MTEYRFTETHECDSEQYLIISGFMGVIWQQTIKNFFFSVSGFIDTPVRLFQD